MILCSSPEQLPSSLDFYFFLNLSPTMPGEFMTQRLLLERKLAKVSFQTSHNPLLYYSIYTFLPSPHMLLALKYVLLFSFSLHSNSQQGYNFPSPTPYDSSSNHTFLFLILFVQSVLQFLFSSAFSFPSSHHLFLDIIVCHPILPCSIKLRLYFQIAFHNTVSWKYISH